MLGSRTARAHKRRWTATALVTMFAPLLLLTTPAAAEDFPPAITNAHISPEHAALERRHGHCDG